MVSFEQVKNFLELDGTLFSEYPEIEIVFDNVKARFEDYCQRSFDSDLYTDTIFPSYDSEMIFVKAIPITKIKTITVNGTLIADTEYKNLRNKIKQSVKEEDEVVVKYFGGFDEIPAELQRAFLLQLKYEFSRKDNLGASSVSNAGETIALREFGLLKEVEKTLQKFKNYGFFF